MQRIYLGTMGEQPEISGLPPTEDTSTPLDALEQMGGNPLIADQIGGNPLAAEQMAGYPWTAELIGGSPSAVEQVGGNPLAVEHIGGNPLAVEHVGGSPLAAEHVGGSSLAVEHIGGNTLAVEPMDESLSTLDQNGANPLAEEQTGGNPLAEEQTGGNPFADEQTGGNPVEVAQTGGNPLVAEESDGNPFEAQKLDGSPSTEGQADGNLEANKLDGSPSTEGQTDGNPLPLEQTDYPLIVESTPSRGARKRGRGSRELGALLMDANGNGRGRRAAGRRGADNEEFGLAVVGGTTAAGGTVGGIILEATQALGSNPEVRITRSKASGRLLRNIETLCGNNLDVKGVQDVTLKRTGKRSAARGGRLGWGNGHESCADAGLPNEPSFTLRERIPGDAQVGTSLENGQVAEGRPLERGDLSELVAGSADIVKEGNSISVEDVNVDGVADGGAGRSPGSVVRNEQGLTHMSDSCNVRSVVCDEHEEDVGSATSHDSGLKVDDRSQQQVTDFSVTETVPSAKNDGTIVKNDGIGAPVIVANTEVAEAGRTRPVRSRKGRGQQQQKVESTQKSEVAKKGKGGKKGGGKKKGRAAAKPTAMGDETALEISGKTDAHSTRGKGKASSKIVVTEDRNETMDQLEKEKETEDVTEAAACSQVGEEVSGKNVKRRQKGRSTTAGAGVRVTKKRQKTGKPQESQLNGDVCSADIVQGSTEAFPSGDGGTPRRGKAGVKKFKNISKEKEVEGTQVGGKKKQGRDPSLPIVRKGATVKALLHAKKQANEEVVSGAQDISICPKVSKSQSKALEESTDQCATSDEKTGLSSLNQELTGDGARDSLSLHDMNPLQGLDGGKESGSRAVRDPFSSGATEGAENKTSDLYIDSAGPEAGAARKSWVLCDDCNKWRCIPVDLADQIESTNARWTCAENPDKEFGDCSVPQEKSNAEINAELQISEFSVSEEVDDKDAVDSKSMTLGVANEDNKPAVWKRIRRNIFQHRRRKVLEIDEMMVCQCTPPEDGSVGCGDNCLNRMLSIECVAEQCPCGEACSNQQFQKRTYAPIEMYRCGKKGFGLQVLENISKGTFIIEYVGEVLDVGAFEIRQQEYAQKGQKHFYFMTLNSNEVIDACSKGNFGRFINHSCEPNCRTEKWMVNGEVCIGLFAVRDILKDEEVTFDYNYVRVCGAAAKKCECGSAHCRGFIGGDPLTPKAVVESDSDDEEDLEPVMVDNSEEEDNYVDENKLGQVKKPRAETEFRDSAGIRTTGTKRKLVSAKVKAPSTVKRVKTSSLARRSGPFNYKGLTVDVSGGRHESNRSIHFSDVQEKLDEMLDSNGGLRKRRDAAKQYLKLLVLTSASGDNRKDATACSVRDLSLLLEALLNTTSRTVLSDIVNKNGLRMLHNLIKQLRRQWDKTPILRKLIKVLELLASERVLTIDLINSSPPRSGMESLSESLFQLTRHKDSEVVQMARRFRTRWIPPRSQLYEQYYKQSMQSLSPVKSLQSDQVNPSGSRFHSPQHPKQASTPQPLIMSDSVRPGPSGIPGLQGCNPPLMEYSNGSVFSEGPIAKDDVGSVRPSVAGDEFRYGNPEEVSKRIRKRPSRWDTPAKVEECSKDSANTAMIANESDGQGNNASFSVGQASPLPTAQILHGSGQFQVEGLRQFNVKTRHFHPRYPNPNRQASFHGRSTPNFPSGQPGVQESSGSKARQSAGPLGAPPSSRICSSANGLQDSAWTLPVLPGASSLGGPRGSGPQPIHVQQLGAMVPPGHLPGGATMHMQMGSPMMLPFGPTPLNAGLQQVPAPNGLQYGVPPFPGRVAQGCSSLQIGSGVVPAQVVHGVPPQIPTGTIPTTGYALGPRPPPLPSTTPYVPWRPPPGPQQFAGSPFPTNLSHRHPIAPARLVEKGEDESTKMPAFQEIPVVKGNDGAGVDTGGGMEPEPPVPGLSPPPHPVQLNSTLSESQGCSEMMNISERGFFQEWRRPPNHMNSSGHTENNFHVENSTMRYSPRGQRRDRDFAHEYYYGLGDLDIRDETGGYHPGEFWETPEAEGFREDVFALVKNQVQKHKLRPTRDLDRFCSKLADVIVRKEVAKFVEHRNQGTGKIIIKSKLVEKVESYVDTQVEQYSRKIDKSHRS